MLFPDQIFLHTIIERRESSKDSGKLAEDHALSED